MVKDLGSSNSGILERLGKATRGIAIFDLT